MTSEFAETGEEKDEEMAMSQHMMHNRDGDQKPSSVPDFIQIQSINDGGIATSDLNGIEIGNWRLRAWLLWGPMDCGIWGRWLINSIMDT